MTNTTNQLTAFNFEGFNVRTAGTAENPLFVAKDVCDVLGISNSRQALSRIDDDEKDSVILNDGIRGNPNAAAVNEFGLYALIGSSRKSGAKKFQRWVNHEVLPQIRKTGSYGTPKLPPVFDSATLLQISQDMARLESVAKFGTELMDTGNLSTMTQVAKPLHTSAVTMNRFLHEHGVIFRVGGEWVPYAKYQDSGHFKSIRLVKEILSRGEIQKKMLGQLKVTGKGIELIHRLWREAKIAS